MIEPFCKAVNVRYRFKFFMTLIKINNLTLDSRQWYLTRRAHSDTSTSKSNKHLINTPLPLYTTCASFLLRQTRTLAGDKQLLMTPICHHGDADSVAR